MDVEGLTEIKKTIYEVSLIKIYCLSYSCVNLTCKKGQKLVENLIQFIKRIILGMDRSFGLFYWISDGRVSYSVYGLFHFDSSEFFKSVYLDRSWISPFSKTERDPNSF